MLSLMTYIQSRMPVRTEDEDGLVAVEYALLGGVVAAIIIGLAATGFGPKLTAKFGGLIP